MIDLTPLEVRKKKGDFKRALRGYDPDEVDIFLDLAADRLEQLVRESMSLNERLQKLEQQMSEYRDRDRALTDALVSAQEVREEVSRQATKEADLMRRQAQLEVDQIRATLAQGKEREEEALRRVRARRNQLVQQFRNFLERELEELEVLESSLATQVEDSPASSPAPQAPSTPAPAAQTPAAKPASGAAPQPPAQKTVSPAPGPTATQAPAPAGSQAPAPSGPQTAPGARQAPAPTGAKAAQKPAARGGQPPAEKAAPQATAPKPATPTARASGEREDGGIDVDPEWLTSLLEEGP